MSGLDYFTSIQLVIALILMMVVAAELGYRNGRRRAKRSDAELTASRVVIKTALLGMVGLLLAFSYSMAAARHELRYGVVLKESNAMGTSWLRTGLLAEPSRSQARKLMRELVDMRLENWDAMTDRNEYQRTTNEMDRIQTELWNVVEAAFNASSEPVRIVPMIQTVNEVIDVSAERKAAAWNHVPEAVIIVMMSCIVISSFLIGHSSGEVDRRDWLMWSLFLAIIAMVFYVVLDLDRGAVGFIRLNPAPFVDLKQSMGAPP